MLIWVVVLIAVYILFKFTLILFLIYMVLVLLDAFILLNGI